MADPGTADVLIKPPVKEKPQPIATPSPAKEKPAPSTKDTQQPGVARKALEDIAGGKPVAEAVAPTPEQTPLPDRETVSQLLTETNSMLLDARDPRILISALATQAIDTPLGNEMRIDTLRMVAKMSNENLPAEIVVKLDELQKKIQTLNLPDPKPEQSQLLQTIQKYNETHQDKPVSADLIDQIKTGKAESAPAVAQLLQSNNQLAADVWKEFTGMDNFTALNHPKAEQILALTEMNPTEENLKKMNEIFGAIKKSKEPIDLMSKVVPGIIIGAMGIMFISQIGGVDQGSGGH